jgi:hypothetical protein
MFVLPAEFVMKKKQVLIILGALGFAFAAFWLVVLVLVGRTLLRSFPNTAEAPAYEATLCDEDSSGLCVVNFGANNLNRMVIYFRLPGEYPPFYVKAKNRDTVSVYTCEADEIDETLVRCTGVRTPLGETVDLEIYATDEDKLIARGTFLVSAIAISTPVSQPSELPTAEEIPTGESIETEEPVVVDTPMMDIPTPELVTEEVPTPLSPADELATPPPSDSNNAPPDSNSTPPGP